VAQAVVELVEIAAHRLLLELLILAVVAVVTVKTLLVVMVALELQFSATLLLLQSLSGLV
jgi:hypothetical protein